MRISLVLGIAVALPAVGVAAQPDYRLAGPFTHANLTIFLVQREDHLMRRNILTLQEALEQKKAIVHETGTVNELSIENVSESDDVFVQAGDLVKGGRQDRTIALDVLVPPRSGKIPVASFCVEAGRWKQRGREAADRFTSSREHLPSRNLRMTVRQGGQYGYQAGQFGMQGGQYGLQGQFGFQGGQYGFQGQLGMQGGQFGLGSQLGICGGFGGGQFGFQGGGGQFGFQGGQFAWGQLGYQAGQLGGQQGMQGGVWANVASFQGGLTRKFKTDVRATRSATSLQLTLENDKLRTAVNAHTEDLSAIIDGKEDVVGFAYAVNGEISSADIYASNALFRKLWPKLLRAAAVEAVAEARDETFQPVTADAVRDFLTDAESGEDTGQLVNKRICATMRETKKTILFDTRNWKGDDVILRRNVLAK
jgi:hypothetical protein